MVPPDMNATGVRGGSIGATFSLLMAKLAILYFLWTPFDVSVRSSGTTGAMLAVVIAGATLACFLGLLLLASPTSREGRRMKFLILCLLGAAMLSMFIHGGTLGPTEYTGNFPFRAGLVLASLGVGYHLAAKRYVKPQHGALVGGAIITCIVSMMVVAYLLGIETQVYRGQGVRVFGTISGESIQPYLLAFAAPLVFLIRRSWLRAAIFFVACAGVAASFRRGPFLCVLIPIFLMPLLDKRRESGRAWWIDIGLVGGLGTIAIAAVGFERVFARWIAFRTGQSWALSERDLIYPVLIERIAPFEWSFIVGHGIGSTVVFLGEALGRRIFGHNDWLELLISLGLLGLIPFVLLHILLFRGAMASLSVDRYIGIVALSLYSQLAISHWMEGIIFAAQHGALLMFFLGASIGWTSQYRRIDESRRISSLAVGSRRTYHKHDGDDAKLAARPYFARSISTG